MVNPPRRPTNPMEAAEAAFKPIKKPAPAPVREAPAAPNVRELVSIRIDRAVLDHFQEDGPGWQDRINEALRQVVAGNPVATGDRSNDD
ncbi:BrnA antitoxin family protein [Mesorhizobium sp. PAMC28654]|uniref:BrnA antitoxin family protein n=1 Tax=Mesorhizobium sp. PAMC28654 TaxID=2880934 RepID=UPI001D0A2E44|nr:BrnA antitoxin family protein [Mesorhizobium sp. PAMC28654]UDL92368.1 BrnA antitoxin family protein [Mesorhizobium sp. PAMC28654]